LIDIDVCDFNLDGKPDFVAPDPDVRVSCLAIHEIPPARYTSTIKEDHVGMASTGCPAVS
jgi:hypothetical protein